MKIPVNGIRKPKKIRIARMITHFSVLGTIDDFHPGFHISRVNYSPQVVAIVMMESIISSSATPGKSLLLYIKSKSGLRESMVHTFTFKCCIRCCL